MDIDKVLNKTGIRLSGIYFISQNNEFVKIGHTGNLGNRYSLINIDNPHDIHIIGFISMPTSNRLQRETKENELHKQFAIYHKKGEWFYLNDHIINCIIKNKWYYNV